MFWESLTTCAWAGKVTFRTFGQATRSLRNLMRRDFRKGRDRSWGGRLTPYRCRHCGGWHIGRQQKEAVR